MWIVLRVIGIGLALFALGYVLMTLFAFRGSRGDAIVTVPDLRGRTLAVAARLADRVDLEVERGSTLPHPRIRRGAVLAQTPLPGEEATRGTPIRVIVSDGPLRRAIPAVDKLPAEQARALLQQIGFRVRVQGVESEVPAGRVVGVRPAAGTVVVLPDSVRLLVSAGPPTVPVPSVVGLPPREAAEALRSAGLRLGGSDYDPYATAPLGEVVAQRPGPGARVRNGTAVAVTISGSAPAAEPDTAPAPVPAPLPSASAPEEEDADG